MPLHLCSSHRTFSLLWSASPFSTAVFLSDLPIPGTGLVSEPSLVKVERRQESSCPSAGMHSSTHFSVKQQLMASACAGYFHVYCCLASLPQDSSTLETLVTCCLLCVCTGLLQTHPCGAFLMLVCIYICRSGNSSNCVCSVQPDRLFEGILHSKGLESKGNVYSIPKVQVNFPLLEVRAHLKHLICSLVVVLSLSELHNSTKSNFEA